MITFAFVFLGLILGVHEVELLVEGDVAAVRLELDGAVVGELEHEPWKIDCDFGASLEPHILEAVALDAAGAEISRIRQLINLPGERAQTAILLEGSDPERPETARLIWQHIEYPTAERITFRFDGEALPLSGPDRVDLPAYDSGTLHSLESEIVFPDGARYLAELNLGGRTVYGADTELTGVTVVSARSQTPGLRALEGRFSSQGEPVRVVGVEKSPARVVMVVEQTAIPALRELAKFADSLCIPETGLHQGEQLIFLFPEVKKIAGKGVPARLFSRSQAFTSAQGCIPWIMTRVTPPESEPSPYRRVTDAVAVAAVEAAVGHRPRTVVLVLGTEVEDTSAYQIEEMRRFLRALNVPLRVWWTGHPTTRSVSEDRRPLTVDTPWGRADDVSTPRRLEQMTVELRQQLDRQLTVWIEGSYLPNKIELAEGARGLTLAE